MFFNKPEPKIITDIFDIVVLGTDGVGLFLAHSLQNLGHRVNILCSPQNADEYNATDFIFKDSAQLKNARNTFNFIYELTYQPQILLIASSPECQKAEATQLPPAKLSDTIIVNFCTPYQDSHILSEILRRPVISAFFENYIHTHKNHITIFGSTTEITFTLPDISLEAITLKNLFQPLDMKTTFSEDIKYNFWSFFGPFLSHALLCTTHNQNIFEISKSDTGRKQIDTLLAEICAMAAADNALISNASLLTKLYEYPVAFTSPLQKNTQQKKPILFNKISSFLLQHGLKNHRKYPLLNQLMQDLYNKY